MVNVYPNKVIPLVRTERTEGRWKRWKKLKTVRYPSFWLVREKKKVEESDKLHFC